MLQNNRPSHHAHKLIAETAVGMAHELYDTMMRDNQWYDLWKKQNPGLGAKALETRFVKKNQGKLLSAARHTLAGMLAHPIDEGLKTIIMEALMLDNTLIRGRH
jgi:hypothetical protein